MTLQTIFDTYLDSNIAAGNRTIFKNQRKYTVSLLVLRPQVKFQRLLHSLDHARLRYGTGDIGRHPELKMAVTKPEVEITF